MKQKLITKKKTCFNNNNECRKLNNKNLHSVQKYFEGMKEIVTYLLLRL